MIENIELLAYVRDTISFCRTLVIKYEDLAKLDNALIKSFYKVEIVIKQVLKEMAGGNNGR